jgi:hypothetical protein
VQSGLCGAAATMGAEQSTLASAPSNAAAAAAAGAAAALPTEKQGPPKALVIVGPSGAGPARASGRYQNAWIAPRGPARGSAGRPNMGGVP